MKRFFILASAAIVALASCTKTEVVYKDGPQEIAFKKISGVMTKGEGDPEPLSGTMGVFAYTSDDKAYFVNNSTKQAEPKEFTKGDTYWEADPKQYYPIQTALDFACYAPYNSGWNYDHTNQTLTSVTYTADEIKATDVLFGAEIYDDCTDNNPVVPVLFKHALAQVSVSVKTNVPTAINITNVTLNGVASKGKVAVDYNSTALNTVTWSELDNTRSGYAWTGFTSPTVADTPESCGEAYYFIANNYADANLDSTNDLANGFAQTSFDVTYTMNGVEFTDKVSLSGAYWEMGKHYQYTITANVVEIQFNPTVEVMVDVVKNDLTLEK